MGWVETSELNRPMNRQKTRVMLQSGGSGLIKKFLIENPHSERASKFTIQQRFFFFINFADSLYIS